jgi:transcription antitermination factor NusG
MKWEKIQIGQRVRILSGGYRGMCGVVRTMEEERQVANVVLDQPCEYSTSEEDFDNLEDVEA